MLPGWTHELPQALEAGVTEAVAGVDWNSADAINRVLDDASCGVVVAVWNGKVVAYVTGIEVFNAAVCVDSAEAVASAVADIGKAIRSRL